jgi:hypothetical protein
MIDKQDDLTKEIQTKMAGDRFRTSYQSMIGKNDNRKFVFPSSG